MQNRRIILASASPRRRELMAMAGYEFEIKVSHKEEKYVSTEPSEIVKELALLKAEDIAEQETVFLNGEELVVIGADTVVAHAGKILGKPKSKEDAFCMIKGFQGDKHQVYTGVAILKYDGDGKKTIVNEAVKTDVYVNPMTDEEIKQYLIDHQFQISASNGILDIFNTSYQIIDKHYDPDSGIMTIKTPKNTFSFLWVLGNGK